MRGLGCSIDDYAGTWYVWNGANGGTAILCNYDYDYPVENIGICTGTGTLGVGVDLDASGTSSDPSINTHGILRGVVVAPGSTNVSDTITTCVRVGHSGQGNCDRMRFPDCKFTGRVAGQVTSGLKFEAINVKIVDVTGTQFGYCAKAVDQTQGGFTLIAPEFESNGIDISLANANDPLTVLAPNSEGSTQFLVVAFGSAATLVSIDGGRLDADSAVAGTPYIDFAARGILSMRGTALTAGGVYSTTPRLYLHNGGAPGSYAHLDGCLLPSDVPFTLTNYADIRLTGCFYPDASGHAVRIPDGRVVAGANMAPAVAAGANAGTPPPAPVIAVGSCDSRGHGTFGTGASPAAGSQVGVTFSAPFLPSEAPEVHAYPTNAAAGALGLYATLTTGTVNGATVVTGFLVNATSAPTASQANTVYGYGYQVVG